MFTLRLWSPCLHIFREWLFASLDDALVSIPALRDGVYSVAEIKEN